MGRTPLNSAKRRVSSESVGVPTAEPWMTRSPQNELQRCDRNRVRRYPDDYELPIRCQAVDQIGHRFRVGRGHQNGLCAAQLLEFRCCVHRFAVDVHARSELLYEHRIFRSTADRGNLVAKFIPELDSKVAEAANALHRNETARRCAAMSQRVKGRDPRAQKGPCFSIAKYVRYRRERFDRSDHVLLISSVVADACNFGVAAVKEVSTPAFETRVVLPSMPAHTHALAYLPSSHTGANFIDYASDFVSRNPRILNSRPEAFLHKHIAMTNAASLHLDAYFSCTRVRNLTLDNFEIAAWLRNLCHFHWRYSHFCSCHNSSFEFSVVVTWSTGRPSWALEPVMPTFALDSCSGARGRKCQTVATYLGVWPQNVSTRRHYEGREL